MKGLIVGSGNLGSGELLKSQSLRADKIICADGGIRYFKQSRIIPDLVIGDLDSATEDEVAWIYEKAISIEQYPMEKDATDMELCIKYLVNNGYNDIVILGGIGTRLDHTLANLCLGICCGRPCSLSLVCWSGFPLSSGIPRPAAGTAQAPERSRRSGPAPPGGACGSPSPPRRARSIDRAGP